MKKILHKISFIKNYRYTSLGVLVSLFSIHVSAQQPDAAVRFANGNFVTGSNIKRQAFKKENIQAALFGDYYFVVLQFTDLPTSQWQQNLQSAGIQLDAYIPGNAYLASVKKDFVFTTAPQFGIASINVVPAMYKISKQLINYQQSNNKDAAAIAVSYSPKIKKETIESELKNAGAALISTKYETPYIVFIEADKKTIDAVAALPFVSSLNLQILKDKPLNYNSRATHAIDALNAPDGRNLNGKGVTVGVGDNADISTHIDFTGRLIVRTPGPPNDHGTHVAGTTAGAGIINVKNHGMAPKATLISQFFSDIITTAPTFVNDNNMVLTNNSYYSAEDNCPGEGAYDILSNYIDLQAGNYKQLLHVVAAGNDGNLTCNPFPGSFGTVKSGWQSAKNVLTVGALNAQDYNIANFSSRGPVADGRIKPEITAHGWGVTSTKANNTYGASYGTSMACPAVTGTLALLNERYRQLHSGANPASALMKALVCNTAADLGNTGPDYTFGFGMLHAARAAEALEGNRYFINTVGNGGNTAQIISVPANTRRIKVMLCWTDNAASQNAATALVNDLDLSVAEPAAIFHRPLILNPAPQNVNDVAKEGTDHFNNIEQVVIENPAAGNYTINVAGFSVPFGPQQYVISYEIIQPSVTVDYPSGGETLVPGETENIRWTADGNEGNTFTLDYSTDNGVTWATINNSVTGSSKSFAWTVPDAVSSNALIRVSRNGTSLSGQSNSGIVILGQPVVTAATVCEGAVQLNWGAVTGATAYDILQLTGDSMKVIGNTAATTFLIQGLNKNTVTWLGVTAKNGTVSGRRSIGVSALPNNGPCTLTVFNNDVKVDSILAPNTARQHFKNEDAASSAVKILIKNLSALPVNGPFDVSFSYGGATVTETVNTSIAPGASYTYTFTGLYTVIAGGYRYDFKAWVTLAADANHLNDTAYKTIKLINNDPVTVLPFTEGFESMGNIDFAKPEMAVGENKYVDFSASTVKGRMRTFVNTGFSRTGNRSITLDQSPFSNTSTSDSLVLNYNLVNYAADQLRFDFYYNNHGQANNPNNKVWIRGSENDPWQEAYNLFINQAAIGQWKHSIININEVLNSAAPAQAITATFQIKIGEEGFTSANIVNPVNDNDDGYTFDDLKINQVFNDIAIKKITAPDKTGCSLTASNPVTITVKNFNNTQLNNVSVTYQVNGGAAVTETIPSIAANQSLDFTFSKKADLAAYIDYNINAWIHYPGDSYPENDSILNYTFHNAPVINAYPYVQGFETSNGNFYTGPANSTWQWGMPAKTSISKAANGTKAWVTNLTGNYKNNETSYLYTPCFDLSGLTNPELSFSHIFEVETDYDYTWVEYSTDGIIWNKLGTAGKGTNWYDNSAGNNWRKSNTNWHVASTDIPPTAGNVRLRFVLSSDAGVTMEGVGIDDISIHEKSNVAVSPPVTKISLPSVSGNNWVAFKITAQQPGVPYILAEINPNGQDLGKVDIELFPNTAAKVRNNSSQYYLDRNFVIHPANPAKGNVGVRLYFTDAEADSLINASGCTTCAKPADAYELGITKYSGTFAEENGTLDDDVKGFFQSITPANTAIIPHGDGYYAEFTVNSFSEFWLSTGGADNMEPVLVNLFSFEAIRQSGKAILSFKTENEINVARFIVERSADGRNFIALDSITPSGGDYNFTDAQPLPGVNYYRVKTEERNGVVTNSVLKKLDFGNNGDDITVFPNPVVNETVFISASTNCSSAVLYNASGRLVKSFTLQGTFNTITTSGISKGIYLLKIISANSIHTEKILIR
jgi:hypothetical protein